MQDSMNKKSITLFAPYPISINTYYRKYNNIITISKKGREFKNYMKLMYSTILPFEHDVMVDIVIHPKLKKNGDPYIKVIDIDNGLKCILDSMNGISYVDDKQIKKLTIDVLGEAKESGGTTIVVTEL